MLCLLPVSSNSNSFINPVCCVRDDVVEFIRHPSWAGHIRHAARPVQLWCQDIVKHSACVPNLKAAWLYTTNLKHTVIESKQIFCLKKIKDHFKTMKDITTLPWMFVWIFEFVCYSHFYQWWFSIDACYCNTGCAMLPVFINQLIWVLSDQLVGHINK